ncbi:MAG: CmcJ/NvfI family oxidoreductase [Pseudomonadota bacterium]|nr:CmcJ/NvfI family oxidoreductase [Pseudomonadota bacterium]
MSDTLGEQLETVQAVMKYLPREDNNPTFYITKPDPNYSPPLFDKPLVSIYDIRSAKDKVSLDENGFEFILQKLPEIDFLDKDLVTSMYYPACEQMVTETTGAYRAIAFDHNVRDYELETADNPVRFVHNDYTESSGPQRVKDLMASEADELLKKRYVFINIWRPLRGPVHDFPLAIIDANSLSKDDLVESKLKYADRIGYIYSVVNNPAHRWYYLNAMQTDEILLLKCFDSAKDGRSRYTAHASFRHPDIPKNSLPRRSIETRIIAFF